MAETVPATLSLSDDGYSVIINPETIVANSNYEIVISGLKSEETGETLEPVTMNVRTPFSPMYCTVDSLKALVDCVGISDEDMMYYIRTASKNADFVTQGKTDPTSFATEEFVRTKATIDCVMKSYMQRSYSGGGVKYQLDQATYEDDFNQAAFKDLLNKLKDELQKWQDALRGYFNEGRVAPKATRIGIKSSQNSDVSFTNLDSIIQDISRSMPQWS